MVFKDRSHHTQAVILAIIFVMFFALIAIIFFQRKNQSQADEPFFPFIDKTIKPLSSDQVATLGQDYIKQLASYNRGQNQAILLKNVEFLEEGLWFVKYEVNQIFQDQPQVYFYDLEVQDGRVIRHNISVADSTRLLLLSTPEPEAIISGYSLMIKGQVFSDFSQQIKQISMELMDGQTFETIDRFFVDIAQDGSHSYFYSYNISKDIPDSIIVKAMLDNTSVTVPVFISQSK